MRTNLLEIELTKALKPIAIDDRYNACRILVRYQRTPIGWVKLPVSKKRQFSVEELSDEIRKQVGWDVVHRFLSNETKPKLSNEDFSPISIVVCTRNRTNFLSTCLYSLLQLNYPEFEIIVVDNAPTNDETKLLVENLPVLYVRENRKGLDWARNRGIQEAKYDLVAFTDDDAKVDPFWLEAINQVFKNEQVMAVSGLVAPAEMETTAQHVFELGYGGMGHGFVRKYFNRKKNE